MAPHKTRENHLSRVIPIVAVSVALIVVLTLSVLIYIPIPGKDPFARHPGDSFSIIQITDTQFLSQSYPQLYNNLTKWIVANSHPLNLQMVIHTGDIVNIPYKKGQWANANNAMMILYNNSVPYCWDAGNHDLQNTQTKNYTYIGENYSAFNPDIMKSKPYWVSSIYDGTSTAVKFSFKNYRFLVINVQFDANDSAMTWMKNLIAANPQANIIVATHNFLNGNAKYGFVKSPKDVTWAKNFELILNKYPNVFMTLNGHDIGSASPCAEKNVQYQREGVNREEIFFNMQYQYDQEGAAIARIYTFDMSNSTKPVVTAYEYATAGLPVYVHGFVKVFHLQGDTELYNAAPQYLSYKFSFNPQLIS